MQKKFVLKIVAAGDGGVGKTTLLQRYVDNKFSEETRITVGIEFFTKYLNFEENQVIIQLWDFGGQERFRFMLDRYLKGAKGAILMFDLIRPLSLNSIPEWINLLKSQNPNIPFIFVGTKLDLINGSHRVINDNEISELSIKYGCHDYIKVSSKTGENVNEVFEKIAIKSLNSELK